MRQVPGLTSLPLTLNSQNVHEDKIFEGILITGFQIL